MKTPLRHNGKEKMVTRTVETGPICIFTEQGKLFFSSARCAEHVLDAILRNRSVPNWHGFNLGQ